MTAVQHALGLEAFKATGWVPNYLEPKPPTMEDVAGARDWLMAHGVLGAPAEACLATVTAAYPGYDGPRYDGGLPAWLSTGWGSLATLCWNECARALEHCYSSADAVGDGRGWSTEGWLRITFANILGMLHEVVGVQFPSELPPAPPELSLAEVHERWAYDDEDPEDDDAEAATMASWGTTLLGIAQAAAAYGLEVQNPAPDLTERAVLRSNLLHLLELAPPQVQAAIGWAEQ